MVRQNVRGPVDASRYILSLRARAVGKGAFSSQEHQTVPFRVTCTCSGCLYVCRCTVDACGYSFLAVAPYSRMRAGCDSRCRVRRLGYRCIAQRLAQPVMFFQHAASSLTHNSHGNSRTLVQRWRFGASDVRQPSVEMGGCHESRRTQQGFAGSRDCLGPRKVPRESRDRVPRGSHESCAAWRDCIAASGLVGVALMVVVSRSPRAGAHEDAYTLLDAPELGVLCPKRCRHAWARGVVRCREQALHRHGVP